MKACAIYTQCGMESTFRILYFAAASSYTQLQTELLPAPYPLHELFALLEDRYPGINQEVLSSCAVSVNFEYVDLQEINETRMIEAGDEVAVIPPEAESPSTEHF
ncbi:hypothetical protein KEM54_004201 [Ascosphaera aggregata]|nr:hypothetical protein KEM54_004201 [Ascosphaera aggregata]